MEAFSVTLGQALSYMCQRLPPESVEKVRRTAKIWGDRRVFSVRFVGELLKGLEPYRNGGNKNNSNNRNNSGSSLNNNENELSENNTETKLNLGRFSPTQVDEPPQSSSGFSSIASRRRSSSSQNDDDVASRRSEVTVSPTADDLMRESSDEEDSDDSVSLFGSGSDGGTLDVTIDASKVENFTPPPKQNRRNSSLLASGDTSGTNKRRRRTSGGGSGGRKRKSSLLLSTQSLQDLWKQLSSLQQQYDQSQTLLKGMDSSHLRTDPDCMEELIGDQLLEAYQRNMNYTKLLYTERNNIKSVANGKRNFEQEAKRYLPWCHTSLQQDDEDLELCDSMERDLLELQTIHGLAAKTRDMRRTKRAEAERQQMLQKQKQEEEEERKRLLEAALAKQEEAKPGMVWNKAAQEYVYLNTEEDWRD